jgi:hypothetical protein
MIPLRIVTVPFRIDTFPLRIVTFPFGIDMIPFRIVINLSAMLLKL